MMNHNLNTDVKISRVMDAVAAGTTDQNGTGVDMKGYDGVMFIASFGELTTSQVTSIHAEQGTDNSADWQDLESTSVGPMADDDDNQLLVLDIYRPTDRYVRPVVDRGTANAVIDGIVALRYHAQSKPTTHDASTVSASEVHDSPAEGTK